MDNKNKSDSSYREFREKNIKSNKKRVIANNTLQKTTDNKNKTKSNQQYDNFIGGIKGNIKDTDLKKESRKDKNIIIDVQDVDASKASAVKKNRSKSKNPKKPKSKISSVDMERQKRRRKYKPEKVPLGPQQRKKRLRNFIMAVVSVIVIIFLVIVVTVFFKVEDISVEGETRYNTNKIISLSGIDMGENIFFCDRKTGANEIESVMPYIENVTIKRKFPNKIIINVTETTAKYAVEYDNQYLLVSDKGKILEKVKENTNNLIVLRGTNLINTELCSIAEYANNNVKNAIDEVTTVIDEKGFNDIGIIDVSSLSNIKVYYKNRIVIVLGLPQNLDYKFRNAYNIIETKLSDTDEGILDVSLSDSESKASYFTPQKISLSENTDINDNDDNNDNDNKNQQNPNNSQNSDDTQSSDDSQNVNSSSDDVNSLPDTNNSQNSDDTVTSSSSDSEDSSQSSNESSTENNSLYTESEYYNRFSNSDT